MSDCRSVATEHMLLWTLIIIITKMIVIMKPHELYAALLFRLSAYIKHPCIRLHSCRIISTNEISCNNLKSECMCLQHVSYSHAHHVDRSRQWWVSRAYSSWKSMGETMILFHPSRPNAHWCRGVSQPVLLL